MQSNLSSSLENYALKGKGRGKGREVPSFDFKKKHPFDARRKESSSVLSRYPDRIPVVVQPYGSAPKIDKSKYLVPNTLTCGQFLFILRRRLSIGSEQALFLHVDGLLLVGSFPLSSAKRDEDGFLYVSYSVENAFG